MTSDSTDLKTECKRERNFTIGRRILAVHMVCEQDLTATRTAELLMQCPDWVGMWVRRYREGGIAALRDCPRSV